MTGSLRHGPAGSLPDDPYRRARRQARRRLGRSPIATSAASAPGSCSSRASSSPTSPRASAPSRSSRRFGARELGLALAGRKAPLKAAILDQRTLAGVGNIYADEALWRARLHPLREARSLERPRCARSAAAIRTVLERGIARQGSTLRDYALPDGGSRRHAARVQGLRARRRAVRPLRDADREDPRRRPRHLVLPRLPAARRPSSQAADRPRLGRVRGRTYKTEAVVLRSLRYSEADRILHLYTRDRGRIGAIAKGVRKTNSRFGARLEPLSHVELMLHEGSGELQTVTGAALVASHRATRESSYRLGAGLIGAEAMLRLFGEPEANAARLHRADPLPRPARRDARGRRAPRARRARALVPAEAPLALRLPAARDRLRRVRRDGGARRLLGPRRRRRLRGARSRGLPALAGRPRRDRGPAERAAPRTPPPPVSPTARAARRSRSSPPPTRSTAASGCARSRHEARPRRRLRARRRPGADRRRRRCTATSRASPTGPSAATTRPRSATSARRRASSASTATASRSASAGRSTRSG